MEGAIRENRYLGGLRKPRVTFDNTKQSAGSVFIFLLYFTCFGKGERRIDITTFACGLPSFDALHRKSLYQRMHDRRGHYFTFSPLRM